MLTGLLRAEGGTVEFLGRDMTRMDTAALRAAGLGHLPADRYAEGGARTLSLADNAIGDGYRSARTRALAVPEPQGGGPARGGSDSRL